MARLAALTNAVRTLDESVARAKEAERLGYDSVWVTQMPDARDAAVVLAAYAEATQWVRFGTGVLPIYTRHPTAMAQMAASLDELSAGRFILGIGVSHRATVDGMWGLKLEHPADAMREYLSIVRASLADGSANVDGSFFSAHWAYSGPRRSSLPIMISALSPRMLELAGELADGVVLWMCGPSYIRDVVVPRVRAGREKAGKSLEGFEVVAAVQTSLSTNPDGARGVFRQVVERYSNLPFYRKVMDASGYAEELAAGKVSDAMIDDLSALGDEAQIKHSLARFRDAGVTLPCVFPIGSHDGAAGFVPTLEAAREA
ncbi:MAG TPA: LLM class flavin-dependent oxidoreductase [Candidatus Dormibacteraeota bacterium]|nr:LLM class flavin-dependent oxidoreductase [Candidatus Dormibacteraeota bacterium]